LRASNIFDILLGIQCDVAESSNQICSALNLIIALLIRDKENITGIRNHIPDLEKKFLSVLRTALDISRAHYCAEIKRVESGNLPQIDELYKDTEILNDSNSKKSPAKITKDNSLLMLRSALTMFDLIENRMAKVNEIISTTI
jgi:Uncharacterised protein family, YAP/Alf4/glomulin